MLRRKLLYVRFCAFWSGNGKHVAEFESQRELAKTRHGLDFHAEGP